MIDCDFSWSPDERYILMYGRDKIVLCKANSGKCVEYRAGFNGSVAGWTPAGKLVLLPSRNSGPTLTAEENANITIPGGTKGTPHFRKAFTPSTLVDCFRKLDRALSSEDHNRFKNIPEKETSLFGNCNSDANKLTAKEFSSWDFNFLIRSFSRRGISISNFSSIVLVSYWRHLNGRPIRLEEQIQCHRAWEDGGKPWVAQNRPVRPELLNYKGNDPRMGPFTIGSNKAKVKIVSFMGPCREFNLDYFESLRKLRRKYPSKNISFMMFIMHFAPTKYKGRANARPYAVPKELEDFALPLIRGGR